MVSKNLFTAVLLVTLALLSNSVSANNSPANTKSMDIKSELAKYKGQVVYLDFWASWCVPCRKSFPWMNEIHKKYEQQGLKVLTINLDADRANADEFLAKYPAQFSVLYDSAGLSARKFKVKGMPSSYLVNKEGKVVSVHVGFFKDKIAEYEQEIEALLAE